MSKPSSSTQKKTSTRRTAMRDIAVRPLKEETFTVHPIDTNGFGENENDENNYMQNAQEATSDDDVFAQSFEDSVVDEPKSEPEPQSTVRVKFSKFVQLVANHDFDEVVKSNPDEDVILSSNLLTELAGAHDEREGKKFPIIFLVGLAIGIVLTYILLSK